MLLVCHEIRDALPFHTRIDEAFKPERDRRRPLSTDTANSRVVGAGSLFTHIFRNRMSGGRGFWCGSSAIARSPVASSLARS